MNLSWVVSEFERQALIAARKRKIARSTPRPSHGDRLANSQELSGKWLDPLPGECSGEETSHTSCSNLLVIHKVWLGERRYPRLSDESGFD